MRTQCACCIHGEVALAALVAKGYDTEVWLHIQRNADTHRCTAFWPMHQPSNRRKP